MPIEVDVEGRLKEIAEATFAVARENGVSAVSYRSVAKMLGGSTTIVTNYLPTRAALLHNAVNHIFRTWHGEMAETIERSAPGDHLRTLALWSCTTEPADLILRHMFIHALAEITGPVAMLGELRQDADEHRLALMQAALQDGFSEPDSIVDAIFLICRGFYLSTVESRDSWPDDRAASAIEAILGLAGQPRDL